MPDGSVIVEYHTVPLRVLHTKHHDRLAKSLFARPEQFTAAQVRSMFPPADGEAQVAWGDIFGILEIIESEMRRVLQRRTVFFWMHLFRRLFPRLPDEMTNGDVATVGLVRMIVECAILKHGSLTKRSELKLFSEADIAKVLGGHFKKSFDLVFNDVGFRNKLFEGFRKSDEWVIVDFAFDDLESIYYVEGLAFQYWRLTAKLRAIGKGAPFFAVDGELDYRGTMELQDLFRSFDKRNLNYSEFDGSSLGIWFDRGAGTDFESIPLLGFSPNIFEDDISDLLSMFGLNINDPDRGSSWLANYVPQVVSGRDFVEAHAYVADSFESARNFRLSSLAQVLSRLSHAIATPMPAEIGQKIGTKESFGLSIMNLCKRAYSTKSMEILARVRQESSKLIEESGLSRERAEQEVDAVIASLTLSEQRRSVIGLWSRGPRFPIVPFNGGYIFDLLSIFSHLHNAFVGVKETGGDRGYIFEESLRKAIEQRGIKLLVRDFKFLDGSEREADAVFFIGDTLIVVDCLSVWRPLDFDISKPTTLAARNKEMKKKVDASLSRVEKLRANLKGRNFDYSCASRVVALVVTPFVEWLWDFEESLWVDPLTPRVMRANEFLGWVAFQRKAP